ncbi:hypothetical protein K458DRAFT_404899 [Lentithecium fluviatile CBS 122367]|uniref:Uncharacterized protein n=1 Tax=Lentithecium fluviatile CBS 122367 TaxID=1168545 RepID=A0A6G1IZ06_9PLEO|nr:hypothetical protein K458DRAFT_404899 [Lentithecium fluviatile CBS 122367]
MSHSQASTSLPSTSEAEALSASLMDSTFGQAMYNQRIALASTPKEGPVTDVGCPYSSRTHHVHTTSDSNLQRSLHYWNFNIPSFYPSPKRTAPIGMAPRTPPQLHHQLYLCDPVMEDPATFRDCLKSINDDPPNLSDRIARYCVTVDGFRTLSKIPSCLQESREETSRYCCLYVPCKFILADSWDIGTLLIHATAII